MTECSKCGKRIVTADRGNIKPSIPSGFEHMECERAAVIEERKDSLTEKIIPVVEEKVIEKPIEVEEEIVEQPKEIKEVDKYEEKRTFFERD